VDRLNLDEQITFESAFKRIIRTARLDKGQLVDPHFGTATRTLRAAAAVLTGVCVSKLALDEHNVLWLGYNSRCTGAGTCRPYLGHGWSWDSPRLEESLRVEGEWG